MLLTLQIPKQFADALPKDVLEYEIMCSEFSFFTIKTVLFQSCGGSVNDSVYHEPLLDAARSSLALMKKMSENQATFNIYKAHSFAHW